MRVKHTDLKKMTDDEFAAYLRHIDGLLIKTLDIDVEARLAELLRSVGRTARSPRKILVKVCMDRPAKSTTW